MIALKLSEQLVVDTKVLTRVIIGNIIRVAEDNAEYSASIVDNDTSDYKKDFQIKGQGPRKMI